MKRETNQAYILLRLVYGLVPLAAGADKFFNLLVDWESYLSPLTERLLPIAPASFMMIVGVVEMAVGGLVLAGNSRLGARLAAGWLLLIAANLLLAGRFDIAVRDIAMAAGAWSLNLLAAERAVDNAQLAESPPAALRRRAA